MDDIIAVERMDEGLWRLSSPLGEVCYLVEGSREAALVDAMGGFGDLAAVVRPLIGEKPLRVLLTHRHVDHVAGAYWFDEAWVAEADADCWDTCERFVDVIAGHAEGAGLVPAGAPFGPRDGRRPAVHFISEGDELDLGDRVLRAVALPGHTVGSMGFLCPELGALFSGDAVTPIMCLCFEESLPLEGWRATLAKMAELPFERFYTGHHAHAFTKADLPGFDAAAVFAAGDRGYEWHHGYIPGWDGTIHLCPCGTSDVDSADFRAVITRGLPPKRVSKKRAQA